MPARAIFLLFVFADLSVRLHSPGRGLLSFPRRDLDATEREWDEEVQAAVTHPAAGSSYLLARQSFVIGRRRGKPASRAARVVENYPPRPVALGSLLVAASGCSLSRYYLVREATYRPLLHPMTMAICPMLHESPIVLSFARDDPTWEYEFTTDVTRRET